MRSSALTIAVTAALLAGGASRAAAQGGGGAPPPPPPEDDETPFPWQTPAAEPTPAEPGAPANPGAEPGAAAKPGATPVATPDGKAAAARSKSQVVLGVELGAGGLLAGGSPNYAPGLGRGFVIGVRRHQISIEWHFLGRYDATVDSDIIADNTANHFSTSSLGLRVDVAPMVSVYGGIAQGSVPMLVPGFDTDSRDGMGPIAGVAYGWTRGDTWFGFELRLAALVFADAAPVQAVITGPPDATGMIPIMLDRADELPVLFTLGFGLRGYVFD